MTETTNQSGHKFGSIEVPADWQVDSQGHYAQTTKEKAMQFFDEKEWDSVSLQMAAIGVTRNDRSKLLKSIGQPHEPVCPIVFVTGGYGSWFWENAKEVVVQEIKDTEQINRDFSNDVPEGKFFIKKAKSY